MNTLLLLVGGYLVLSPKGTSTPTPQAPKAPAPSSAPTGSDLAAAFGAFVGGLISQASKDNS